MEKKNHRCTPRVLLRASSHVLYLLSFVVRTFLKVYMELGFYFLFLQEQIKNIIIMESTEPKQVYDVKLDFVSERTIKDHHHQNLEQQPKTR
jgi:hypothetical protein